MATTPTPVGPPLIDHAGEAGALIQEFVGRRNLLPAEAFAVAQVHATLAVALAAENQGYATEALLDLIRDINEMRELAEIAAERPAPNVRSIEHRGYSVAAGRLLPGVWAVDVYRTDDPDHGEGTSSFISFGGPSRAMRRGVRVACRRAEHEQLAQAAPKGLI